MADPTPVLLQERQEYLDECASISASRHDNYQLYEAFYTGYLDGQATRPPMTDRVKKYLEWGFAGRAFNENFCSTVCDVIAERLEVESFKVEGVTPDQASELEEWVDTVWSKNRLDSWQGVAHTVSVYKGDAFVLVDYDPELKLPRVLFNQPELITKLEYSEEEPDVLEMAAKCWKTERKGVENPNGRTVQRLNLYFPDRVERYFRPASKDSGKPTGGWQPWHDEPGERWPLEWKRPNGDPRGVPVFHFRYQATGQDYGRSELASVISFQNELNKQVIDLHEVLDYMGWPQRWATGMSADEGELAVQPGNVWRASSKEAAFGQFNAADPTGLLNAIEGTLSRLARRSRTPMHLLTGGTPPSGEALKTAESGLVKKVERVQVPYGDVWESVIRMAHMLAVDNRQMDELDESLRFETQWESVETRNEFNEAQTCEILATLGVSEHSILARLGYSYEDEQGWKEQESETLDRAAGQMLEGGPIPGSNGQPPVPEMVQPVGDEYDGLRPAR